MNNPKIKWTYSFLIVTLFILLVIPSSFAYKIENGNTTHQHITNESKEVWILTTPEIKKHLQNTINVGLDIIPVCFDDIDDIITGSGEEDTCYGLPFLLHFWQPDIPAGGDYNYGLFAGSLGSSYVRAVHMWDNDVVKNYLKGDTDKAYYYLGRVAHLLEDATQPSHVHLDPHPPHPQTGFFNESSVLEDWAGNNFALYDGLVYSGDQYNYENLISGFNWNEVDATGALDKRHIELFRLFWYTAQKTQYWASDDENANYIYVNLTGSTKNWDCSGFGSMNLWSNDGYYFCFNFINESSGLNGITVQQEANATVPHAMRAVAGLYRLFEDAVGQDWFTYHHDNRRTGTTILKGDLFSTNTQNDINFVIEGNNTVDTTARPSIADIDRNGKLDIVVSVSTNLLDNGSVYDIERSGSSGTQNKWKFGINSPVEEAATLADTNNDGDKEVVFGLDNGLLYVLNPTSSSATLKWRYNITKKYSGIILQSIQGNLGFTLVANIDSDPKKEIIFADGQSSLYDWPGTLYVLEDIGSAYWKQATTQIGRTGGARGAISTADIDNDGKMELVVPAFYELRVYDVSSSGSLSLKWNASARKTEGSVAIYDTDYDNQYELVYTTSNVQCTPGGCSNTLYIRDASTGTIEHSISLSVQSRVGVAIANLDTDANPEIVINGMMPSTSLNQIQVYDAITESQQWTYPSSGGTGMLFAAPNIADVNGDGQMDILLARNSTELLILRGDGSVLTTYSLGGAIGSSPVVGDIDNDGVLEIAVKRAGSPINILTMTSGLNEPPVMNPFIENVSVTRVNDLIDLNVTGTVFATDTNNFNLTYLISPPFNASFQWIPTINDTGVYNFFLDVSDGNLSDTQEITVLVFDENTTRINNFTDGSSQELLNFTGIQNQTLQIRIPKNASILYTSIKLEGKST